MEKERILSDLKTKIGDPNVAPKFSNITDRTLNEYVDKIFPTIKEGDVIDDSFYNTHVGILETLAGNIRFAASSAVEDFKKNLKQEPPAPQPNPSAPTPSNPNDEITKKLKELDDFKKSLEGRYESEAKAAQLKQKLSDAKSAIQKEGADNEKILKITFGLLKVEADEPIDSVVKKAKDLYNETLSDVYGEGYNPAFGTVSKSVSAQMSADAKKRQDASREERKKMRV